MTSVSIAPLDVVAEAEAIKYRAAFAERRYRRVCHGLDLWRTERRLFPPQFRSAIDLGCGVGRLLRDQVAMATTLRSNRWLDGVNQCDAIVTQLPE